MGSDNKISKETSKKDRILEAAKEVFSKRGYYEATTQEIAEVAGTSKGLVFHYFQSKEELFKETLISIYDSFINIFKIKMKEYETSSFKESIKSFVSSLLEEGRKNKNILKVLLQNESIRNYIFKDKKEEIKRIIIRKEKLVDLVTQFIKHWQNKGEIRADIPPEEAAYIITNCLRATMVDLTALEKEISPNFPEIFSKIISEGLSK